MEIFECRLLYAFVSGSSNLMVADPATENAADISTGMPSSSVEDGSFGTTKTDQGHTSNDEVDARRCPFCSRLFPKKLRQHLFEVDSVNYNL